MAATDQPAGLLTIPQELRDNIYSYCGHTVRLTPDEVQGFRPPGPCAFLDDAPNVNLLCTSRQINEEYAATCQKTPGTLTFEILAGKDAFLRAQNQDLEIFRFHPTFPMDSSPLGHSYSRSPLLQRVKSCVLEVAWRTLMGYTNEGAGGMESRRPIHVIIKLLGNIAYQVGAMCKCQLVVVLDSFDFHYLESHIRRSDFRASTLKAWEMNHFIPFAAKGKLSVNFLVRGLPAFYTMYPLSYPAPPNVQYRQYTRETHDILITKVDGTGYVAQPSPGTRVIQLRLLDEEEAASHPETQMSRCGFEVLSNEMEH